MISQSKMTPKTQLLYAFTESPMVKNELFGTVRKVKYKSQTKLNFD